MDAFVLHLSLLTCVHIHYYSQFNLFLSFSFRYKYVIHECLDFDFSPKLKKLQMVQSPPHVPEKLLSVGGILKKRNGSLCGSEWINQLRTISIHTERSVHHRIIYHLLPLSFRARRCWCLMKQLGGFKLQVMRSIRDNITHEVLLNEIKEIIRLPMYADRIRNDSKPHQHLNSVRRRWWMEGWAIDVHDTFEFY